MTDFDGFMADGAACPKDDPSAPWSRSEGWFARRRPLLAVLPLGEWPRGQRFVL